MRGLEGDKQISDPHFFPIYEEAGRLDLPICVHSATGSFAVHDYFLDECGFNKFKLAVVGSFHSLIFNKIPDKFPKTTGRSSKSARSGYRTRFTTMRDASSAAVPRSTRPMCLRKNKIWVTCQTDDDLPYVLQVCRRGHAGDRHGLRPQRHLVGDSRAAQAAGKTAPCRRRWSRRSSTTTPGRCIAFRIPQVRGFTKDMVIDFQAHLFPEAYLNEMKRLDGAVILEEPDPYSGMTYFLRQEAQMSDQHGESFKARTSSADSSTWTSSASIFMS